MTEDDILNAKPYTQAPEPTLPERAAALVDSMLAEIMRHPELTHVFNDLPEKLKEQIDGRLLFLAMEALGGETATAAAVEKQKAMAEKFSGEPLEPEEEGEVFQVQVGGLLLSEQKER